MPAPAADRFVEATAAAVRVAERLRATTQAPEVLHQSNNVIVRFGDVVLKVSTDFGMAERDVVVATHVNANGGPALAPLLPQTIDGEFSITAWPFVSDCLGITDREAGQALHALHRALVSVETDLPPLSSRFDDALALLADVDATAALDSRGRPLLRAALEAVASATEGDAVLHTEPHDRNRLRRDGQIVYIDFEAASTGPIEWDLAYLPDAVTNEIWPGHDPVLRAKLRIAVSACVSIACWRHVTARPHDNEMRRHAEYHLDAVRRALPDE